MRQFLLQTQQHAFIGFVVGFKKTCHEVVHDRAPFGGRMLGIQLSQADGHSLQPLSQIAHLQSTQTRNLRQGPYALPCRIAISLAGGITQYQTLQSVGPGVLLSMRHVAGHTPFLPVPWIQAPAHRRGLQPIFQGLDIGLVHLKLRPHSGHFKQAEPFRQSHSGFWQV